MEDDMKSAGGDNDVDMMDADLLDPNDTCWNTYGEDDVICMNGGNTSENEESQKENRETPNKLPTNNSEPSILDLTGPEPFPLVLVAAERKRMGNEYFVKGEYQQAHKMYTAAIEILPTEAAFFGNRAACLIMLHKYKDAVQDARMAVSLDCNLKNGHIRLVRSTLALGDVISCEAAIAAVVNNPALNIDLKDESIKLATLIQLKKDIDGSIAKKDFRKTLYLTERAKEIAGGDVMIKIKKAEALVKLGRFVEAQEQCTDILQSEGMIMEAITLRAYCFYQADNLDKSLQYYKQALQLAPDNTSAAANYKRIKHLKELRESGANKFKAQHWKDALEAYKQCLDLIKSDEQGNQTLESKINFNLSLVANKNDPELSLTYVSKAIDLNPNYLKAILHRAQLLMVAEKYDEAIKDFEAVEKIDPHMKDIRRLIDNAKLMSKRAKRKDYYKILGIDKKASNDEIKKAYKKRALVHHPDRHANATETERRDQEKKFKEVLEAYEILLDDKKRRRYDLGLDVNESYSPSYEPFDASQLFGHMFFQQSGMGGMGSRPGGFHQFRGGQGFSGFRR